jgi:hypothetical protein
LMPFFTAFLAAFLTRFTTALVKAVIALSISECGPTTRHLALMRACDHW